MTPQQNGRNFEFLIKKLLLQTKYPIYDEKQIRKEYCYITGIDHILLCNNTLICFQDKWTCNNISNKDINHFVMGINQLKYKLNNFIFIGVYLSKNKLSCHAQKIADDNNIISINDNNTDVIIYKIMEFLYKLNIYIYDEENDIIMLNNY